MHIELCANSVITPQRIKYEGWEKAFVYLSFSCPLSLCGIGYHGGKICFVARLNSGSVSERMRELAWSRREIARALHSSSQLAESFQSVFAGEVDCKKERRDSSLMESLEYLRCRTKCSKGFVGGRLAMNDIMSNVRFSWPAVSRGVP